jgi:hypothetical protein
MNIIKLKKDGKKQYFITELTSKEYETLLDLNKKKDIDTIISNYHFSPDNVVGVGSTSELSIWNLRKYVAYLRGYAPNNRMPERRVAYRDYSRSEEKQRKSVWLVNVCEDSTTSANSLIKVLKLPFIAIWFQEQKS